MKMSEKNTTSIAGMSNTITKWGETIASVERTTEQAISFMGKNDMWDTYEEYVLFLENTIKALHKETREMVS